MKTQITLETLEEIIIRTGKKLISAAGDDPFISRADVQQQLEQYQGTEKKLLDVFYRFTDELNQARGAKVTEKDLERAVDLISYDIYGGIIDLSTIGLSAFELDFLDASSHLELLILAYAKRLAFEELDLKGQELAESLVNLAHGLYIANFSSESETGFEPFFKSANLEQLTQENFSELIDLSNKYEFPFDKIGTFIEVDDKFFTYFLSTFEDHEWSASRKFAQQGRKMIAIMKAHLRNIHFIILGTGDNSNHPSFWVGLDRENNVVGLETETIWT